MWRGYHNALALYGTIIYLEWRDRGFQDTLYDRFIIEIKGEIEYPGGLVVKYTFHIKVT
jgi:hypothetical protein